VSADEQHGRPVPATGHPARPVVVLVSGHLVDAPNRPQPRFPPSRVAWVTEAIRRVFAQWRVGPGTTVISGGARGADIIAAEVARDRGARVLLCLALPPDEFERRSVDLPGTDWVARFRRLLAVADVRQLTGKPSGPAEPQPGAPHADEAQPGQPEPDDRVFHRANSWMVELARQRDPQPYTLVVWDSLPGDGPGGTADLVRQLGYADGDCRLYVIDPTPPGA
jgi:hypothetical protein